MRVATTLGFPGGSNGKESSCNAGDPGSISRSGRSPGEGNGNTLVFLSEEFHGQRILASYSPWSCRVGHDWATCTLCHYFKLYGPYHQGDVLFYGLIIGWFWVPNLVATPCSIYLQRKSKCSFFLFFFLKCLLGTGLTQGRGLSP